MRGGFLHNKVLIEPLDTSLRRAGAVTHLEYAVRVDDRIGYVDLFAELIGRRIAVEAERSVHRIEGDLRKAEALEVDELWIVVPTAGVARSVRRKLRSITVGIDCRRVFVLTQGQALQRVRKCLPFIAGA